MKVQALLVTYGFCEKWYCEILREHCTLSIIYSCFSGRLLYVPRSRACSWWLQISCRLFHLLVSVCVWKWLLNLVCSSQNLI